MAKKGTTQSPKAGAKPKSQVTTKKTTPKKGDRRKSNEPVVEKVVEEEVEAESEEEVKAPKANGSKASKKRARDEESSDEDSDEDGSDEDGFANILAGIDDSDSESDLDSEEEGDNDEEEDIDVDELSELDEEDEEQIAAGTRVRQTINNKEGLLAALRRFALDTDPKTVPFAFHQTVVSSKITEESIPSVEDDLQRELAFMTQSLEAARQGRALLRKEGVPFTRPTDFFAETVRTDETMQKVKAKMIEEATAKKASAEARKQRDLKKFGKQVQVQKQQERAKQKRDTLEKINLLKKSMFPSLPPINPPLIILTSAPLPRTPRRHLRPHRRKRSRRPLRRGRRQRAQDGRQQQEALGRRPRRAPQPQAPEEGRQVRLRRQEALRQVGRRQVVGRPERLQREAHEGRLLREPRRRWAEGPCEAEVGEEQAAGG
jgi:rRNA-processing protein EBP2